jgi:hypothetical protein
VYFLSVFGNAGDFSGVWRYAMPGEHEVFLRLVLDGCKKLGTK